MKVLVAYASRHGATRGIAERIGQVLSDRGLDVMVRPVGEAAPAGGYDAFVVGSGAYMGRWLKEAARFVLTHRDVLSTRPVWLFSSGPIGDEKVDKHGQDVLVAAEPIDFRELAGAVHPRGTKVFFGAFDPEAEPVGLAERFGRPFMRMPAAKAAMPAGDFRDWPAIDAWANEVASGLIPVGASA
ncbi:MAG TPA: flavodoxin domain-containing protein [Candidatus Limnocylindrales bacterium]|nr:flavodoxin domain-containing protein [Candidatus Limnocylindrales bacterium]